MKLSFQNKHVYILGIFSILFFFLYNFLNFSEPGIYNSPDETANAVFISQFAEYSRLSYPLPYEYGELAEFIHPRSTFVEEGIGSEILPVGFWGMVVVYGLVAKIVSIHWVVFLTSILAIGAVLVLYDIFRKIFDKNVAFWSSILLFIQPVWWYYTARSFLPNVPFVALMIIGVWLLICNPVARRLKTTLHKKYTFINDVLGMVLLMTGVLIRPNEILWIAIATGIVIVAYRRQIPLYRLVVWIVIGMSAVVLYGFVNQLIYANPAGSYVSSRSLEVREWYSFIFPFGIDCSVVLKSGWQYFVRNIWWITIPSGLGFIFFAYQWIIKRNVTKEQKIYLVLFAFISLFLFVYYGSNVDTLFSLQTISVAYTRYWIPIFILSLPFVIIFLQQITHLITHVRVRNGLFGILIGLIVALNVLYVFRGVDGLLFTRTQLSYAKEVQNDVLAHTDSRAILVTDQEDKFFWPERQVIVRFFDPRVGNSIGKLINDGWEVYYFTYSSDDKREQEITNYLEGFGLTRVEKQAYDVHELYRILSQ